jgi:hypothetical protein
VLDIPYPPGLLTSSGTIGPFSSGDRARTPGEGRFELGNASFDRYKGVAGSHGKSTFRGRLENLPRARYSRRIGFQVNRSGNRFDLRTAYLAAVNGATGDACWRA